VEITERAEDYVAEPVLYGAYGFRSYT
jgi:hypothetical protein